MNNRADGDYGNGIESPSVSVAHAAEFGERQGNRQEHGEVVGTHAQHRNTASPSGCHGRRPGPMQGCQQSNVRPLNPRTIPYARLSVAK